MIGALADDFTGATDIASAFRRSGLQVHLVLDPTRASAPAPGTDVVVIGLKTRTIPAPEAVAASLEALRHLADVDAEQVFFKYCSTFDSRDEGNIGPVADALADAVGAGCAVVVPASPAHGRTQYLGHLFVGDRLLSESPMRDHPLTPMTDPLIPRVLSRQTPRTVELADLSVVRDGTLRERLDAAEQVGTRYLVVDALTEEDLGTIGAAVRRAPLVTGAAGLAAGLGAALAADGTRGRPTPSGPTAAPSPAVRAAALAGSCSARTLEQVDRMCDEHPHHFLDALSQPDPEALAETALAWYDAQPEGSTPLIYSSQGPDSLQRTQEVLGTDRASEILEAATAAIARGLVARGVGRLVVAGGETSGAVATALGVTDAQVGEEAAPGVPWLRTTAPRPLDLLLKSGNFGGPDLLLTALHPEER